jgi:hypothetical protein
MEQATFFIKILRNLQKVIKINTISLRKILYIYLFYQARRGHEITTHFKCILNA